MGRDVGIHGDWVCMARLLFVEDDPSIAEALGQALRLLGHVVTAVGSAEDGSVMVADPRTEFDLAIVDVMLPGMDGFEFCRRVTLDPGLPVILLTARSDPIDIVVGLECGADDYVTKPVQPRVLDARIKTVLRRSSAIAAPVRGVELGAGIVLDQLAMTVSRGGADVHLTPTEMRLLVELVNHRGQVLTRRRLLERVWEYGYAGDARLVDAAVQRLRAKIEIEPSQPTLIHTVRGLGYRMDPR
jgi:DNA-binding response OmpR family regulator